MRKDRWPVSEISAEHSLRVELQCHLHLPRRVAGVEGLAEDLAAKRHVGRAELRIIEGVERLQAIFEPHTFANRTQAKLLEHGQVGVRGARISHFPQHAWRRAARVLRRRRQEVAAVRGGEVLVNPDRVLSSIACLA